MAEFTTFGVHISTVRAVRIEVEFKPETYYRGKEQLFLNFRRPDVTMCAIVMVRTLKRMLTLIFFCIENLKISAGADGGPRSQVCAR